MEAEPTYTVFIRLPFPRGDFVDPPPVNWDASKDEALWNILSGVSKTDIDWNELATRFQVTVDFLLQQVTWLTERHASQVRAQMRKATTAAKGSSAPSPVPGSDSGPTAAAAAAVGAQDMRRTASGGGQRAPSSLSVRRDSPAPPKHDQPGTPPAAQPPRPAVSRNSSTNTARQSRLGGRRSSISHRRRLSSLPISAAPAANPDSPGPADSEDSDGAGSSDDSSPVESRIIRRPPRFQAHGGNGAAGAGAGAGVDATSDEDEDAEPAFLTYTDPGATLKGDPRDLGAAKAGRARVAMATHSQTSDSSTSSAGPLQGESSGQRRPVPGPGLLSPRRTVELAGRRKPRVYSREGSEGTGTPSISSSFSDLDDASVTQSALEEALASNMQNDGGLGSRMSMIGNAFKSRYLPKSNR